MTLLHEEVGKIVVEKGLGTIRVGSSATVFMPRSFYVLAILVSLVVGVVIGRFVL